MKNIKKIIPLLAVSMTGCYAGRITVSNAGLVLSRVQGEISTAISETSHYEFTFERSAFNSLVSSSESVSYKDVFDGAKHTYYQNGEEVAYGQDIYSLVDYIIFDINNPHSVNAYIFDYLGKNGNYKDDCNVTLKFSSKNDETISGTIYETLSNKASYMGYADYLANGSTKITFNIENNILVSYDYDLDISFTQTSNAKPSEQDSVDETSEEPKMKAPLYASEQPVSFFVKESITASVNLK